MSGENEKEAYRNGIDLKYEHSMQEKSEQESLPRSDEFASLQPTVSLSPRASQRIPSDMDESMLYVDLEYEHHMQEKHCQWKDKGDGHFLNRNWVTDGTEGEILFAASSSSPKIPVGLHTHARNLQDESVAHDCHPFIGLIYLLRNANVGSTVYFSMPFLTDLHVIDELHHHAKPVEKGGRGLVIRIILGPQKWVALEFQRYVGNQPIREAAVALLQIRKFGTDKGDRSSYAHSKAVVSTAGAIIGSYNYTYASRYRHREDACFLPPGVATMELQARLHSLWEVGDPVLIRCDRPPPGYVGSEAKRPKVYVQT